MMKFSPFESPFPSDRVLEGLAREVVTNASADHYLSEKRKLFTSSLSERLRLARELHDGLLQSLTGATLQLEAGLRLMDSDPRAAREQFREAQELIVERQRELRSWIDSVRHPRHEPRTAFIDLTPLLAKLCQRVGRWGPRVELDSTGLAHVPASVADHVYRIVQESLNNVARHANARVACVEVRVAPDVVRIVVIDDGCGFAFRGRHDLATLNAHGIGPASIKERVASLAGKLVVTSTLSGSKLEIELPARRSPMPADVYPMPSPLRQEQS
jgi:signal transduction histidine kinase